MHRSYTLSSELYAFLFAFSLTYGLLEIENVFITKVTLHCLSGRTQINDVALVSAEFILQ